MPRDAKGAAAGKMTDAMRLVAAAKVRAAQTGLEKSRPFSDELLSMIKGLVKKLKGGLAPQFCRLKGLTAWRADEKTMETPDY